MIITYLLYEIAKGTCSKLFAVLNLWHAIKKVRFHKQEKHNEENMYMKIKAGIGKNSTSHGKDRENDRWGLQQCPFTPVIYLIDGMRSTQCYVLIGISNIFDEYVSRDWGGKAILFVLNTDRTQIFSPYMLIKYLIDTEAAVDEKKLENRKTIRSSNDPHKKR